MAWIRLVSVMVRGACALAFLAGPATAFGKNDLTVASVSGPTQARSGDAIQVAVTVAWGTSAAPPTSFRVGCYLSTDATITTSDVLLGTVDVAMSPGQTVTTQCLGAIPSAQPTRTYYLGAFVDIDNVVAETNEGNNAKGGNTIAVSLPAPDLAIASVTGPTSVTVGESIQVSAIVTSSAFTPPSLTGTVAFYLSTDGTITAADALLASAPVTVGAGQSAQVAATIQVAGTVTPATYRLGAIVDPANALEESDEENNALAGPSVQVLADNEPPVITVTGISDGAVAAEAPVTVCYTIADLNPLTDMGELDLLPFSGCTSASTAGEHSLVVNAADAYGNSSNRTMHFFVDLASPSVTILSPFDGAWLASTSVDVVASVSDDVGIATVTANGAALTCDGSGVCRGRAPLTFEGANVLEFIATDLAGRTSTAILGVQRDTALPYLTVNAPSFGANVASPFEVAGTVSDAALGALTIDGLATEISPRGTFTRLLQTSLGPREISIRASDMAGNSTTVVRTVTVVSSGTYLCYDGGGNLTARLDCAIGTDCASSCP